MSDPRPTGTPHIATAAMPVPNWGRQVSSEFGTASWNRRDADEISQTIPHHIVLLSFKPINNRELSCPLLSGPSTMRVWIKEGTTNACEKAQA